MDHISTCFEVYFCIESKHGKEKYGMMLLERCEHWLGCDPTLLALSTHHAWNFLCNGFHGLVWIISQAFSYNSGVAVEYPEQDHV